MAVDFRQAAIDSGASLTQLAQTGSLRTNSQGVLDAFTMVGSALDGVPDGDKKEAAERALTALQTAHENQSGPLDTLVNTLNEALNKLPSSGGRRRKTRRKTRRSKKGKSRKARK